MKQARVVIGAVAILMASEPSPVGARDLSLSNSGEARFLWPAVGRVITSACAGGADATEIAVALGLDAKIHATERGRVTYAGQFKGFDSLIVIRHNAEWTSIYGVNGIRLVRTGDAVQRGQVIARGDHADLLGRREVRFELRRHSAPVNPLVYLEKDGDHRKVEKFCAS